MAFCGRCGTRLEPQNIDRERELGTCESCGNLVDLRPFRPPGAAAAAPPAAAVAAPPIAPAPSPAPTPSSAAGPAAAHRVLTDLPKGISVTDESGGLVITRVWWRTKHVAMVGVLGVAVVWLAMQWVDALGSGGLPPTFVIVLSPFILFADLTTVAMFITKTRVFVGGGVLDVHTGPLPFAKNARIAAGDLSQLYAVSDGPFFAVMAELKSGGVVPVLRPIPLAEQALAIEERIEHALGIADRPVEGELSKEQFAGGRYASVSGAVPLGAAPTDPVAAPPRPPRDSVRLIALLPISLAIPGIAMMVHAFTAAVEGSLQGRGEAGAWTFAPDDCSSGQTAGFFGVELTSAKDPKRRVRLMKDELGQPKIAVLVEGAPPVAFDAKQCPGMNLEVGRSGDVTNDVYLIEGSVTADCGLLGGTVKFERCGL